MEPIYRYSEGTTKPLTVEVGKRTVFLRKNIVEEKRTDELGNVSVFYTCQEARLKPEEFNEYSSFIAAKNAINGVNDSENIEHLVNSQENGDNNQLIIMDAIADLYDVIAMMM